MCDTCDDSRFELIKKYKGKLLDATNIDDSQEEMAVIDNILFRFWQMGWLAKLELFGNPEQLDTVSRRSVIKEIDELLHTAKGESEHDLKMLRRVIKDMLPSTYPTLYGYDIRSLIIFADAVKKKEITESEIEDFVRNARAAWEYAWEEFQRTQKEALESVMRGVQYEG